MKKKLAQRQPSRKKEKNYSHIFVAYSLILFGVVCLFLIITRLTHPRVLGTSTFFAYGGDTGSLGEQNEFGQSEAKENKQPRAANADSKSLSPRPSRPPVPSGEMKTRVRMEQKGKDGVLFREGSIGAKTKFRIPLNHETKRLTISTPSGARDLPVMPNNAVKNLLLKKIITKFEDKTMNASPSVNLTEKNNKPVFEITGISRQRLFGFIPVDVHKSVDVSAQTGQVVSENESFGQRLLDFLSF